jgi:hypothetical protein
MAAADCILMAVIQLVNVTVVERFDSGHGGGLHVSFAEQPNSSEFDCVGNHRANLFDTDCPARRSLSIQMFKVGRNCDERSRPGLLGQRKHGRFSRCEGRTGQLSSGEWQPRPERGYCNGALTDIEAALPLPAGSGAGSQEPMRILLSPSCLSLKVYLPPSYQKPTMICLFQATSEDNFLTNGNVPIVLATGMMRR